MGVRKDDLTVSSENGGKAYIDSPNIEKYGVQEGYKDYSDYTSADKLYRNAKWEFDEDNEDRIDVPQLTISGKLIDLSKLAEYGAAEKLEIGDTVHVFDIDGTEYVQRVIEYQAIRWSRKRAIYQSGISDVIFLSDYGRQNGQQRIMQSGRLRITV